MKPCQGIVLNPIKGSLLAQAHAQAKPLVTSRYAPPSKRKEEPKTLTKDEISSDILFPSLSPMKPMTSGASWSQLQTRLSTPNPFSALSEDSPSPKASPRPRPDMNFMRVVDERMKREKAEAEEGIRREGITEPSQMTMEQRDASGWTTLRLPGTPAEFMDISERLSANPPLKEEYYYDSGHKFERPWIRGDPVECVHLGGTPIERTEKLVDHFANFSIDRTPVVVYSPICEASVAAAKAKFAGFFKKSEKYSL